MTTHKTGTREEWLAARLELLEAEKELTRRSDELARRRQELPWVRIDKDYRFDTDEGTRVARRICSAGARSCSSTTSCSGPTTRPDCPACSAIADGFNGFAVHLANHDVMLWAVSRAPLAKLQAYKQRMGWSFPWASSYGSDFNYDFQVGVHRGAAASRAPSSTTSATSDLRPAAEDGAATVRRVGGHDGTDWADLHARGTRA